MYKDLDISQHIASLSSGNTYLSESRFLRLAGIKILNEVNISGYNVEVNNDGSVMIGGNTYELTLEGVSKYLGDGWKSMTVEKMISPFLNDKVSITEITPGDIPVIKGAIGSLTSELPLEGAILDELSTYIKDNYSSFTLHGPNVAIKFELV